MTTAVMLSTTTIMFSKQKELKPPTGDEIPIHVLNYSILTLSFLFVGPSCF